MTEKEWLRCTEPEPMVKFLWGKASHRKMRLVACACCRCIWHLLADERSRSGVKVAENYADDTASLEEYSEAREESLRAMEDASGDSESAELGHAKWHAAEAAADCTDISFWWHSVCEASRGARQAESCHLFELVQPGIEVPFPCPEASDASAHSALIHDIFGNPFRPVARDLNWLAWNGGTVTKIAKAIYDERELPSGHLDPARLAILADALEEAGCNDTDILAHCRSDGPHVRGCWLIDLLLGKE